MHIKREIRNYTIQKEKEEKKRANKGLDING